MTTGPSETSQGYVVPETAVYDGPPNTDAAPVVSAQVVTVPTQVRRPWRSTIRTAFQTVLALATLVPFVVAGVYTDGDATPVVVGQVVLVAGTITRVMALPQVEKFLQDWVPWLAAAPAGIPNQRSNA